MAHDGKDRFRVQVSTTLNTTRKIDFREGSNPSLNYHYSLTNEFSDGFSDDR
jgi:hypothetical protein